MKQQVTFVLHKIALILNDTLTIISVESTVFKHSKLLEVGLPNQKTMISGIKI